MLRARIVASLTWYSAGPAVQSVLAGAAASVWSPRAPFAEFADGHGYSKTWRLTADHGGSIRLRVPSMSAHASAPDTASALVYCGAPVLAEANSRMLAGSTAWTAGPASSSSHTAALVAAIARPPSP